MRTVRWLHISDLHLNTPGYESSFLRDELPKFLKRSNIAYDYVFCTGDLRDAQQIRYNKLRKLNMAKK